MIRLLLLVLCGLFVVSPCRAASIGLAVSGNIGSADEHREWNGNVSKKHNYDQTRESIGLAASSMVDKESIFSNHFELLYTMMQAKEGPNKYKLRGITAVNDFCFGIVRKNGYRIWIGPELVVEHLSGPRTRDGESDYAYHTSFGIGGAVGINIDSRLGIVFVKGNYNISGALMANGRTWEEKYGGVTMGVMYPFD